MKKKKYVNTEIYCMKILLTLMFIDIFTIT